jgi:hypothetical protein
MIYSSPAIIVRPNGEANVAAQSDYVLRERALRMALAPIRTSLELLMYDLLLRHSKTNMECQLKGGI